MAAPVGDGPLPADPTPVLAQPVAEQVADAAPTAAEVLQAVATEPSLAELGLAGYTPVGLVQNLLEFMHVDLGLPWWGAIVVGEHAACWRLRSIKNQSAFIFHILCFVFLSQRNGVGSLGCVSSHSEGPEGGGQAEQRVARNDQTHQQDEWGQTERKQIWM